MSTGERDCQHLCCDDRGNPFHDHFLPADQCPGCERLRVDDRMPTICLSCREAIPAVDYMEHRRGCQDDIAADNEARKRCTCRQVDHQPTDCPYPAGCTGCLCSDPRHHTAVVHCEGCGEFTVHPDQHEHADEPTARFGR